MAKQKRFTGTVNPGDKFILKPRHDRNEGARVVEVAYVEKFFNGWQVLYHYTNETDKSADLLGTFRMRVISRAAG